MKRTYWDAVEPVWDKINIYDGPEEFLRTYQLERPEIGLLYAAHFCQSEVCNGGFYQFFYNSTGVLCPEAIAGFAAIGQSGIAQIVREASLLLGSPYPRDRSARQSLLEPVAEDVLDHLDDRFFALIRTETGGFDAAATHYAGRLLGWQTR